MAYSAIAGSEIDADSPITAGLMTKLRDNPIAIANGDAGAPRIQAAALDTGVALANIAAGTIGQGKLNTSTGGVSRAQNGLSVLTLPGGQYGFYPQLRVSAAAGANISAAPALSVYADAASALTVNSASLSTSATTYMTLANFGAGITLYADQRYINSSPPYNLGDGEVPLFVFALINSAGEVESTYTADVPPWAYNGPTRVTADRITQDGRKFQRRRIIDPKTGDLIRDEIEITDDIKNADMGLIPHPFAGNDLTGKTVVLLDPVETLDLLDLHEMGECVSDLLYSRHLMVDNQRISRAAPPGVQPCAIRWKQAQQKWRAVPSVMEKAGKAPAAK